MEERNTEVTEALDLQTATSEVLRLISANPGDLGMVLDGILTESAALAGAEGGTIMVRDGDLVRAGAVFGDVGVERGLELVPANVTLLARDRREPVLVDDIQATEETEGFARLVKELGIHSFASTALFSDDEWIGNINLVRHEVRPFEESDAAILHAFADQAVIAIANAGLFNELEERNREITAALEQQTAMSEVLEIISRSTQDEQPVLEEIARQAGQLLGAPRVMLHTMVEGKLRINSGYDEPGSPWEASKEGLYSIEIDPNEHPEVPPARALRELRWIAHTQRRDDAVHADLPETIAALRDLQLDMAETFSGICVPLVKSGVGIGVLQCDFPGEHRFTDAEVKVLETFADQAVIAIENARLIRELEERNTEVAEALDQQTAMAEILEIIAVSPTDTQPVFQAIADRALILAGADRCDFWFVEGEEMVRWARSGPQSSDIQVIGARRPSSEMIAGRAATSRDVIRLDDVSASAENETERRFFQSTGERSAMFVPLLRDGAPVGVFTLGHKEPNRFTTEHETLLKTFGSQALIAMENTRLFTEQQEALERQAAMAEVLEIIAASPTDPQPVFEAILASARRLSGARAGAVGLVDGDEIRIASQDHDPDWETWQIRSTIPLGGNAASLAIETKQTVHVPDILEEFDRFPGAEELYAQMGHRTTLVLPLVLRGEAIGNLSLVHDEVLPFSDAQIAVMEAFADQAVIAIENSRLFNELEERNTEIGEALELQTASSEVLQLISERPGDLQTVLDGIVRRAMTLCDADAGTMFVLHGDRMRIEASAGNEAVPEHVGEEFDAANLMVTREAEESHQPVFMDDYADERYFGSASYELGMRLSVRSNLLIPMFHEGRFIGQINVNRTEVRPFDAKQAEILQTFADQAAIAIANAGLFNELEERNREVTEALEQQTAMSEVLEIISRSTQDEQPVLEEIARQAAKLIGSDAASFYQLHEGNLSFTAIHVVPGSGFDDIDMDRWTGTTWPVDDDSTTVLPVAIRGRVPQKYTLRSGTDALRDHPLGSAIEEMLQTVGSYSGLIVPLVKGSEGIGALDVQSVGERRFNDRDTKLLQTFADQAVIAIENARLIRELEESNRETTEALEQQTAMSEVLEIISRSTHDEQPVLEEIARQAAQLIGAEIANFMRLDGEELRYTAFYWPADLIESAKEPFQRLAGFSIDVNDESLPQSAAVSGMSPTVYTLRPGTEPHQAFSALAPEEMPGISSCIVVPLIKDGQGIGALELAIRGEHRYDDREIKLLQTFSDQAVIAIENARLIRELEESNRETTEALKQQTAMSEVLEIISRSTQDEQPVLEEIARQACELIGADVGTFCRPDDGFLTYTAFYLDPDRPYGHIDPEIAAKRRWPVDGDSPEAVALRDGKPIRETLDLASIVDAGTAAPAMLEQMRQNADFQSSILIPLKEDGEGVGVIGVAVAREHEFTDRDEKLLQTFADQALIAIENARLIRELEESNTEVTEALEQQTAMSEVLEIISRSTQDEQPVLEEIARQAAMLIGMPNAAVCRLDDGLFSYTAMYFASEGRLGRDGTRGVYRPPMEQKR